MRKKEWDRVLVVNDASGKWFVRRVASVEYDAEQDETVYRCDAPVGSSYRTPIEAITAAVVDIGWGDE